MNLVNAFTVDVEDYFQVSKFDNVIRRDQWSRCESRVVANTHRILELLDRHDVKGTFFVLGWVADRFPQLVRDIQSGGHECGSHSHEHRLVYRQTPQAFRDDLRRSRQAIADACGERVTAYRAPSFSITKRSLWALDVLAEEGFLADSSIFPIHHDHYGIPGAEPGFHRITTAAGPLWEFPPSVVRLLRLNLPVAGGGYFRLYPLSWTMRWLRQINQAARPFLFYIHPWELDPEQPRLKARSRLSRFRHYTNLSKTERRLDVLCSEFRFGRLCDMIVNVPGNMA